MIRRTVDTNVPIVANGRSDDSAGNKSPSIGCRQAAINFLISLLESGKILLDSGGAMQSEYHRHLSPRGQPGVGDRFYQAVLNSAPRRIERVELPLRPDGEYADVPQSLIDARFDPSDRKFAAMAKRARVRVSNATDSDWIDHRTLLADNGIVVEFVCGCDVKKWFSVSRP